MGVPEYVTTSRGSWPGTVVVNTADLIPAGMGLKIKRRDVVTQPIIQKMIKAGMPASRAAEIVNRARGRVGKKVKNLANRGLHLGWRNKRKLVKAGVGDDEMVGPPLPEEIAAAEALAAVQKKGNEIQQAHANLISKLGANSSDLTMKNTVENEVGGLYNDWTQYGVSMKGGAPPVNWNRLNPVDAILLAVRDDLRNTIDLIQAGKAQAAIAKQVANLPTFGMPGKMPTIKVDLPWYVWAGGAVALAAATKAAHLW